jgi:hypothetical protein
MFIYFLDDEIERLQSRGGSNKDLHSSDKLSGKHGGGKPETTLTKAMIS